MIYADESFTKVSGFVDDCLIEKEPMWPVEIGGEG
jgi:hypothetical protein